MTTPRPPLSQWHQDLGAVFLDANERNQVTHYGDPAAEYAALTSAAALLDLGFRGRLCLTGTDRVAFLNGQVTQNIKALQPNQGCLAALVDHRGKLQADLAVYALANELLLDFEPGLTPTIQPRLERFVIAEDVQVVDVSPHYGLLSLQGPLAATALTNALPGLPPPQPALQIASHPDTELGELYVVNRPRYGFPGFDLYGPVNTLGSLASKLLAAIRTAGGQPAGWDAAELARVEAAIPRFGADMDDRNLAPETGLETQAISYSKGCYIGQEVIARIRTYGQVSKSLRGLRLNLPPGSTPPKPGTTLCQAGKDVGLFTSVIQSPRLHATLALGYVRKECNAIGSTLEINGITGATATVTTLPFHPFTNPTTPP